MELKVTKSRLAGNVLIPASKSHTIRAVAIASLAQGNSCIINPLISNDTLSAVECYKKLGANIDTSSNEQWLVEGNAGNITAPKDIIDVGNSGTTLRIAAGSASLCKSSEKITFTGDEQIQTRPIAPLLASLNELGANAVSVKNNGKAPIEITGTIKGGKTTIECFTSQYLSSLLLAAPLAEQDTEINVTMLNEPDYVKMTLNWLDEQNIKYENDNLKRILIKGSQKYTAFKRMVPADFSSATFFICGAALLHGDVTLEGLDFSDSQPDKAVAKFIERMGVKVIIDGSNTRVIADQLNGIDIDMNATPDALPAMAVIGAFAKGTTRLLNVPQARCKETDRIHCMAIELAKMGADIQELPDGMIIKGSDKLTAASVCGHGDHRIVMAMSLAGMACEGHTCISTAQAMNVTFPNYVELMNSIGGQMTL